MTVAFQCPQLRGVIHVRVINPQGCIMTKDVPGHGTRLGSGGEPASGACEHTDILSDADLGQAVQMSSVCSSDPS